MEKQSNLAINVFDWDKGVTVHSLSKQPQEIPRINLLLIKMAGKFHYTWIKNISRLLYDQSKHRERKHFWERCLHGYRREYLLEAHRPECRGIGQTAVRVEMPEEGKNKLTFQNHHKQMPPPPPPPTAAEHFLESLQEEECKIKGVLAEPKAMRMAR